MEWSVGFGVGEGVRDKMELSVGAVQGWLGWSR